MAARADALAEAQPGLELLQNQQSILDHLAQLDPDGHIRVMAAREGGLIDCYVPFDLIDNTEVPVDEDYARELATKFSQESDEVGGSGQHTPSMLGLIEGEPTLKIIDGFHRTAALRLRGEPRVYATIKVTDWDGLYDERIYAAKEHAHVKFARAVQWMREIWAISGLPDKMTLEQAALLYRFNYNGGRLGLSPQDADKAKTWIARKEAMWQMPIMTIHGDLKVAEHVDPALVHATRIKTSSNSLDAPTQSILKVFSEELPDRFELQQIVMKAAMAHNLQAPAVRSLSQRVKDCVSVRAAQLRISKINWDNWQPEYSKRQQRDHRLAHHPGHKGAAVLDKAVYDIRSTLERIDLAMERHEEISPEMRTKILAARERAEALVPELGNLIIKLYELVGEKPPLAAVSELVTRPASVISKAVALEVVEEPEFEPDFDATEEDYEADEAVAAVVAEDEEEIEEDEKVVTTDTIWDADLLDDDEDEEEDETPEVVVHESRLSEANGHETLASKKFKEGLSAYLNGKADDYPDITNRQHLQWAENLLARGGFRGPLYLQDELREELRQIEKQIKGRLAPATKGPTQNWRGIETVE